MLSSTACAPSALERAKMWHGLPAICNYFPVSMRRGAYHGHDLLLLTQQRPPASGAGEAWPPEVHVLAIVERVERMEGRRDALSVQGIVSFQADSAGACSCFCALVCALPLVVSLRVLPCMRSHCRQ